MENELLHQTVHDEDGDQKDRDASQVGEAGGEVHVLRMRWSHCFWRSAPRIYARSGGVCKVSPSRWESARQNFNCGPGKSRDVLANGRTLDKLEIVARA